MQGTPPTNPNIAVRPTPPRQQNIPPGGSFLNLFSYVNTLKFLGSTTIVFGLYKAYIAYSLLYSPSTATIDPADIRDAVVWVAVCLGVGAYHVYEGFRLAPIHRENAEFMRNIDAMARRQVLGRDTSAAPSA